MKKLYSFLLLFVCGLQGVFAHQGGTTYYQGDENGYQEETADDYDNYEAEQYGENHQYQGYTNNYQPQTYPTNIKIRIANLLPITQSHLNLSHLRRCGKS